MEDQENRELEEDSEPQGDPAQKDILVNMEQ